MKICFWGKIADALMGNTYGGGELQIAFIAKSLASRGHEVVVVDLDSTREFITAEGIRVIPVEGYNKGIKGLRTITHRLPALYSTFIKVNADVYYCRIREYRHVIVYMAARKVNAKFILGLASDLDILSIGKRWKHFYSSNVRDFWGVFNAALGELVYPFLLKNADLVMVQHQGQQDILNKKRIRSLVFCNVIDLNGQPYKGEEESNELVYVGSLDKRKGFADFYYLVTQTPDCNFKVIGRTRDKTGEVIYDKLKSFPNVILKGKLSHELTIREIARSRALVSTSPMEGFPNIFIEAWSCGVPVLSLFVDPGGIISREGLGFVAGGDIKKLINAVRNVTNNEEFRSRATEYVHRTHEITESKINEINSIFTGVLNQ